ncbi:MAG: hypothetical protein JSU96_16260 [Acidobacteriota bacterium]|nr:MAG: hypothetical protein JSU96_16260 [Acidobacteriota bacterium]
MKKRTRIALFITLLATPFSLVAAQDGISFDRYHSPEEVVAYLEGISQVHSGFTRLHRLSSSPGGREVAMLELGPEITAEDRSVPAVFVAANMEGTIPISTEAALQLIQEIIAKPEIRQDKTWYVLPSGNPDAAAAFFSQPLRVDSRNGRPHNDDLDDQTDEDGFEDLNDDGIISSMRVRDPEGEWIPIEGQDRLMKRADSFKGEKGIYKLYAEGIDNDEDGEYNEDPPGGVNIGINFPHLFKAHTATGGPWAGSEDESYNLIRFIMEHREIGLVFTLGDTNSCLVPPKGGRRGEADLDKIRIPERIGERFGVDTSRTYSMDEIIELMQPYVPAGMQLTESMVASFLGLGAVVNPLPDDLNFYKELSEQYKEYLKEKGLDKKRLESADARDGSFELWAYYHLGVPSFSLDFWTLPEPESGKKEEPEITPEKLEQMTNEEFIALGEEKIDTFLKSVKAPGGFTAKQVIGALEGGMMTTKRMAEMLKNRPKPPDEEGADPREKALLAFSDSTLDGTGFLPWTPFQHPTLGEVEIGGARPFAETTPPPAMLNSLLEGQVPWIFEIAGKMARIKIGKTQAESLGAGLYRIRAWIENTGYLPYPTAMGTRNERIMPVVVSISGEGMEVIEGKQRSLINSIKGNGTTQVKWIIRVNDPTNVEIKARTETSWSDQAVVELGGAQ